MKIRLPKKALKISENFIEMNQTKKHNCPKPGGHEHQACKGAAAGRAHLVEGVDVRRGEGDAQAGGGAPRLHRTHLA